MSFIKKTKSGKKGSDLPKRIEVEMVGGSDRPGGPPGLKGLQVRWASMLEGPPGPKGLLAVLPF